MWAVTTEVDTRPYWEQVWSAAQAHASQLPPDGRLGRIPSQQHERRWGTQRLYRAFSLVNGGAALERDLFEGIPAC